MKIRLIRHATLWIEFGGVRFLLDPMLSEAGANPPIPGTANSHRNPLVPLPVPPDELSAPDAVLVTHLHQDHWDAAAASVIRKGTPVFTQPCSVDGLRAAGFGSVEAVDRATVFQGVTLTRTGGQHGSGPIRIAMGHVSGFVLQAPGEPVLYVAGDTVWCSDVKEALDAYRPDFTIVNAGGARFLTGDPITMNGSDITELCRYAPYTRVAAVHLDAINHCLETRTELQRHMDLAGLSDRVSVPDDGAWISWGKEAPKDSSVS
jgi:L-ascorbate metabolism protein UlaG (beta-lactamase superfamily)